MLESLSRSHELTVWKVNTNGGRRTHIRIGPAEHTLCGYRLGDESVELTGELDGTVTCRHCRSHALELRRDLSVAAFGKWAQTIGLRIK